MKNVFAISVLLILGLNGIAQSTKVITITGQVSGDTKGFNYVYHFSGTNPPDSVLITKGKFVIKLPFNETHTEMLMSQYGREVKGSYQVLQLLIDGTGDVHIKVDIEKGFSEAEVSGSATAVSFCRFRKQQADVNKKVDDDLTTLYGKAFAAPGDPFSGRLSASRDSLYKLYLGGLVSEFVAAHKDDFLGVFVLRTVGRGVLPIEKFDSLFQSLSSRNRETAEGEKIAAYIRGVHNTTIGATVKNFVLNDPEGRPISFEQFKGKYVWIDFWASWCAPCKRSFPHMKEIYAKYKDKGFEILGISTDTKIDPWLAVLPTLQNPWPQVWDNKNVMSEFAVTAFPTSFLINPEGKIILKEVGYNPDEESTIEIELERQLGANDGPSAKVVRGKEENWNDHQ